MITKEQIDAVVKLWTSEYKTETGDVLSAMLTKIDALKLERGELLALILDDTGCEHGHEWMERKEKILVKHQRCESW